MVTISTVGYGDISPSSPGSTAFTAFYMLFGIAIVFGLAGELFTAVTGSFSRMIFVPVITALAKARRTRSPQESEDTRPDHANVRTGVLPALKFYAIELLPSLILGFSVCVLLSAYIFTLTEVVLDPPDERRAEELTFNDAIWHTWVTATTVGYGDVPLTTMGSKLWASAHILISVSWLASMITGVQAAYQERQWQLQRAAAYHVQLQPELIAALETPEARAEGRGVNVTEFVCGSTDCPQAATHTSSHAATAPDGM